MATKLKRLRVDRVDLVDRGANPDAHVLLYKRDVEKAEWDAAYMNDLPDSAFAYIEPGGEKDGQGKTVPRSLRHFPYKNAAGEVDMPHLRNAMARAPQSPFGAQAMPKLHAAAQAAGMGKAASLADSDQTSYTKPNSAGEPPNAKEAQVAETSETVAKADHDAILVERDALKAELDKLKGDAPAQIDKSQLPESVIKALEEADALRIRVAKMEADQRSKDFVAKAAEFKHVADEDDLGPVLEALDRLAPEQAKVLDQALKAANARIAESGLFKTIGSDGGAEGQDPKAQAEAFIKKAMTEDKLSYVDAFHKVFNENPSLWPEAKTVQ